MKLVLKNYHNLYGMISCSSKKLLKKGKKILKRICIVCNVKQSRNLDLHEFYQNFSLDNDLLVFVNELQNEHFKEINRCYYIFCKTVISQFPIFK